MNSESCFVKVHDPSGRARARARRMRWRGVSLLSMLVAVAFAGVVASPAMSQVDVTAAFSDDATEAATGVFITPPVAPVTPANFANLRISMRPITVDSPSAANPVVLDSSGGPIELWRPNGTRVTLPASIDPGMLPQQLLVNARHHGTSTLTATQAGAGSDSILFRAGPFPGLAGRELAAFPFFEQTVVIQTNSIVQTALDPVRHSDRIGQSYDVYIVKHRGAEQWALDNVLFDESGAIETATVTAGGIQDNVVDAWTTGLVGAAGTGLGVGYDVVYDFGMDGTLDPGDLIDGVKYSEIGAASLDSEGVDIDEAGFYIVHDLTQPGPFAVQTETQFGGSFMSQRYVFPADIANMGELPLIQISHGNGHVFTWYAYLQEHLASYGYIVSSHANDTMPGINAAAATTLSNLEFFLGNLDTIRSGIFEGHVDKSRIMWIGHSRGGEGILRAYDQIVDGAYVPVNFRAEDVVVLSSIAPTDFLGPFQSLPYDKNYHMIYGSADGDVSGTPGNNVAQALHLLDRGTGFRNLTYVHGADHNDFNCCGFNDFQGPPGTQIGRDEAQRVAKAAYLALAKRYFEGNVPAKDYLWRQYESLKPIGVAPTTTVVRMYIEDGPEADTFVIDDFQSESSVNVSSSGGAVTFNVSNLVEGVLDDGDGSFSWTPSDPMNGMTYARANDSTAGIVFDYNSAAFLEFEVVEPRRDLSRAQYLSFRACQGTRHPNTAARLGDLTFEVTLRDGTGTTSTIEIGVYGGGLEEPYQRTGAGTGAGWQNEFETVRILLTDFEANGSGINLSDIEAVRFEFGEPSSADAVGRIGLDDVEINRSR